MKISIFNAASSSVSALLIINAEETGKRLTIIEGSVKDGAPLAARRSD